MVVSGVYLSVTLIISVRGTGEKSRLLLGNEKMVEDFLATL